MDVCGSLVPGWPVVTAEVDEDGEWFVEDLLEGHYEVTLDLPSGYRNSDMPQVGTREPPTEPGTV